MLHLPVPSASLGFCLNYVTTKKAFSILGAGEWVWEDLKALLS